MDMTKEQEAHLEQIISAVSSDIDAKYRAGQKEHGGNLWELSEVELLEEAIKEVNDLTAYLYTLLPILHKRIEAINNLKEKFKNHEASQGETIQG